MRLQNLRSRIDQIDLKLLRLLNQRAALALRVGALKRSRGLPLFDRQRERVIIRHVLRASRGPLPKSSLRKIFLEILRQNRRPEGRKRDGAIVSYRSSTRAQ